MEGSPPQLVRQENVHREREATSGTQISAGFIEDIEHNTDLKGKKWYGEYGAIGISGKMLRDGHIRQSISYITDPLRSASWVFKPASKDPRHIEQADFCQWAFVECLNWDKYIKRTVADYSTDGFSLSEMTYDNSPYPQERFSAHPGMGRAVVPTGFHEIPNNTVDRWFQKQSDSLQVDYIKQWQPHNGVEPVGFHDVYSDIFLRFTLDQNGADFTGFPILRGAYAPWKCKIAFMAIDAIKHERRGVGTPILILGEEPNDEDIEAAERALEQMRTNARGYVIFPNGYQFQWDTGSKTEGTDLELAIERCNKDIAINVSAGFMMLGLTGKSGSYALGATQQSQYHLSIAGHAAFFGNTFVMGSDGWSPVRRILELNYGEVDALPRLEAKNLPTRNWIDIVPMIISAVSSGLVRVDQRLRDEMRDIFQLPPEDMATVEEKVMKEIGEQDV